MKAILVLVNGALGAWADLCGQCAGAEQQLQSISSALAVRRLDRLSRSLIPWSNPIRTVPDSA